MTENTLIEQAVLPTFSDKKAHVGMPPLTRTRRAIAFFEFWPTPLVYLPVAFLWLFRAIQHRSLTLPLCANPGFYLGGMVGESKAANFSRAGEYARQHIADWCRVLNEHSQAEKTLNTALEAIKASGLEFPLIAKPDMGCRGQGVRIVRDATEVAAYLQDFPDGGHILFQQLVPYEAEAGIFYIRHPGESRGQLFSITLKYQPYVYGNGIDTLKTLIQQDPRAGQLTHLYFKRHEALLDQVIPEGQPFRLAFAGSHSRGAIFRDGRHLITDALTTAIDQICQDIDGFYYGRFDVRFRDTRSLQEGNDFTILEVNGVSSEAAHIWDADSSLREVYKTLFHQYNTLFRIGAINRRSGARPDGLLALVKGWQKEKRLGRHYPDTE